MTRVSAAAILVAAVTALGAGPAPGRADLKPDQVAIIAAKGNGESEALARQYAQARGIPEANICLVDVPPNEECSRQEWRSSIRPAIRQWLAQRDPQGRLRCLATVWGVPLKIGPAPLDGLLLRYREFLAGERSERLAMLDEAIAAFDRVGSEPQPEQSGRKDPSAAASDGPKSAADAARLVQARLQLNQAAKRAQLRIDDLPVGGARAEAQARLKQLVLILGGNSAIVQNIERQLAATKEPDPAMAAELERLRAESTAYEVAQAVIEARPAGIDHDALAMALLEPLSGQMGVSAWLEAQLAVVEKNESAASFDSELALVAWPDDYQLLRWQPNYLRPGFDHSQLRQAYRTLMVARLDGPTPAIAKGLIDAALEAEKSGGLAGKAYIDVRGLAKPDEPPPPGSAADFDRGLLITAHGLREKDGLEVVLNEEPGLFQPQECPDAALYCGWYSLNKYVDAFEWRRGAIAFHLDGVEAGSLHDATTQQWCKRLLEDGVAATLGPVGSTTLEAFPRPEEFFALIAHGDLTLAECYWRSVPYTSWQMTLIGDPLYRPYAGKAKGREGASPR